MSKTGNFKKRDDRLPAPTGIPAAFSPTTAPNNTLIALLQNGGTIVNPTTKFVENHLSPLPSPTYTTGGEVTANMIRRK